ncbi:MAG: hypothetical protein BWY67_01483 [Bacteroidetes bacterium ADurb.Bin397]|nr:MAG: hypothetical protein BWY67_01483 [Bacteroidetes bacterium ADurb.Bin397]
MVMAAIGGYFLGSQIFHQGEIMTGICIWLLHKGLHPKLFKLLEVTIALIPVEFHLTLQVIEWLT